MHKKLTKSELGSSLIEVIGVLVFLSAIATGIYSTVAGAHGKIRATRGYEETKRIVKAMRDQFSSFPPSDTSSATLYKLGIFENVETNASGNPLPSGLGISSIGFKMDITLPETSYFYEQDKTFKLTYYAVDTKTCVTLLLADWGSDPSSGLAEISVGGGKAFRWPKDYNGGSYHPIPVETKDAITECKRASRVNISWEFFL